MRYIFVIGGSMSGIGKGVSASSIGVLLKDTGLSVTAIKIDPYLNLDAGTMSPYEHGECYVLADGGETDLDLGNYERFLNVTLTQDHNITTGKVYNKVLKRERNGDYLGRTVQIVPHITDEIINWIDNVSHVDIGNGNPDICVVELGGTVGDIENAPFIEAIRQMVFRGDSLVVHVTYIPMLKGEFKTKPTQNSVKELMRSGITADILLARSEKTLDNGTIEKLRWTCSIKNVYSAPDLQNIYNVPVHFRDCGVIDVICNKFGIKKDSNGLIDNWKITIAKPMTTCKKHIWIIGKYTKQHDAYLSLTHAIDHACVSLGVHPHIYLCEAGDDPLDILDKDITKEVWFPDAVIIPGGFDKRGVDGKIATIRRCRELKIPILGICLGMQLQVVEYARNVIGIVNAHSEEMDLDAEHVVIKMEELDNQMGGTMRLGLRKTQLTDGVAKNLYNTEEVWERHRHRYEINPDYVNKLESGGLQFTGRDGDRMEILELPNHPFFIGCQFHPEYQTYPNQPHPLFIGLIKSTL